LHTRPIIHQNFIQFLSILQCYRVDICHAEGGTATNKG
jgi:hypothetical protein